MKKILLILFCLFLMTMNACSTSKSPCVGDSAANFRGDIDRIPNAYPKNEPLCRYGNPESYDVEGKKYYVLKSAKGYCKTGLASWYGTKFHGKNTSSREPYDMFAMTAASRNLPLPTYVEVTNLENGKKIIVKVNDRGPFKSDRIIDLSYAAATKLGFANKGTANVEVRAIDTQELHNGKIASEILLTNNNSISEIQINPIALPVPEQKSKAITLERYLQLGAFANEENARRLKQEISASTNASIVIKEGVSHNKPIYRVQIGPFKNVDESDSIMHSLKEKGYTNVITVFS